MSNIIRHDPFEDLFRGFFVRPVDFGGNSGEAPQMRVDVQEGPENYRLHAELPGIAKEDIHVHIDGPVVSISAERKARQDHKDGERVLRTDLIHVPVKDGVAQLRSGMQKLRKTMKGAISDARAAEVDRKIADLQALRRELGSIIDQCGCGTIAECRIIEALSP